MNDISIEEIEQGLRALANNKAAVLNFIPAELLKWGGVAMVEELTETPNIVTDEWKRGAIVKLFIKRIHA